MIRWSKRGRLRRRQCVEYIARESGDWPTAWKWEDDVFDAVAHLEDFPLSGSVVREFGRSDVRQVLLGDYRIIYRVKDNIPEIISIRHVRFRILSPRSL
ncbi:MAG: type II toxin-antitoxin system RelE/ParE family toxin [Kiritimatiellae bacterium]|nr:type II toxin-antitoxin system RelE/ParE family toxin [Kiritimatiellia bacterium]